MATVPTAAISLDTVLGLVGVGLSLLGLAIALRQLGRTRTAVAAAAAAAATTERQMTLNRLLVLMPSVDRLERDLDQAVHANDRDASRRQLADWGSTVSPIQGLLTGHPLESAAVQRALRDSVIQAGLAKSRLARPETNVVRSTEQARKTITEAARLIGLLSGQLQKIQPEIEPA